MLIDDTVLFDGKTYWRYCIRDIGETYLLSCEKGYLHNPTEQDLMNYEKIGSFRNNKHLFICD